MRECYAARSVALRRDKMRARRGTGSSAYARDINVMPRAPTRGRLIAYATAMIRDFRCAVDATRLSAMLSCAPLYSCLASASIRCLRCHVVTLRHAIFAAAY